MAYDKTLIYKNRMGVEFAFHLNYKDRSNLSFEAEHVGCGELREETTQKFGCTNCKATIQSRRDGASSLISYLKGMFSVENLLYSQIHGHSRTWEALVQENPDINEDGPEEPETEEDVWWNELNLLEAQVRFQKDAALLVERFADEIA